MELRHNLRYCLGNYLRQSSKCFEEQTEVAVATLAWSICSISMTILNKLAVNHTRAPIAVVIVQMLATCAMAAASCDLRFGAGWKLWAITVPPLFVLMMATSMLALQYVTVGTFVVVRNLGPVVTLGVETALHRPDNLRCDLRTTGSLLCIVFGVALYEAKDVKLSLVGLTYLFANLLFACTERLVQRHLLAVKTVDVSKPALMILNNGIGALLAAAVLQSFSPYEWHHISHALRHRAGSGLALGLSCVVGCAISYSGLWLQRLVTATSFMVIGSTTKLVVILFGIVAFADANGMLSIIGAGFSIAGSYGYARLQ